MAQGQTLSSSVNRSPRTHMSTMVRARAR
jgi:hypothetical protein